MTISASLLSGLFGLSDPSVGTTDPAAAIALLKRATAPGAEAKGVAAEKKDPVVITAMAQFDKALASAKDLKSALGDPRVLAVLLPAMGLSDQASMPALAQRALLADPNDKNGLLGKIDARWKAAATSLGLFGKDITALRDPALQQTLKAGYLTYQYQKGLDKQQPGISDALYFINKAAGKSDNVYNVLGDSILRRVVTGALNLPPQLAVQSVERQATAITTRLPLSQLKDPLQVYKIAQRYVMSGNAPNNNVNASQDMMSLAISLRH